MSNIGTVFIGLDLGNKYSEVCILNQDGEVIEESRPPTTQSALRRKFTSLPSCRQARPSLWRPWAMATSRPSQDWYRRYDAPLSSSGANGGTMCRGKVSELAPSRSTPSRQCSLAPLRRTPYLTWRSPLDSAIHRQAPAESTSQVASETGRWVGGDMSNCERTGRVSG